MSPVGTDVVAHNLVRNYSPHLHPNTREAPPVVELRDVLSMTARDMLEAFLRKWRRKLAVEAATPYAQVLRTVSLVSPPLARRMERLTRVLRGGRGYSACEAARVGWEAARPERAD